MLQLLTGAPVPADTMRVAKEAIPEGNTWMALRDRLGAIIRRRGLADRDARTRTSHKTRCSRQVSEPLLRSSVNGGLPFLPSSIRRKESKAVAAGRNADRCIEQLARSL